MLCRFNENWWNEIQLGIKQKRFSSGFDFTAQVKLDDEISLSYHDPA